MGPKNLSQVSGDELKEFIDSFDDVLCDCDGVLFIMFRALPGAGDCVEKLTSLGKGVKFVSNNSTRSMVDFTKSLNRAGLNAEKENVIIPVIAIVSYLKSIKFDRKIFVIGFSGLKREITDAGFQLADYGPDSIDESVESFAKQIQDDPDVGAVIVDFDLNMNYLRLQKALVYIRRPDVLYITAGTDKHIPVAKDVVLMGGGYFQDALREMSGKEAMTFGKPGKYLNEYILGRYKFNPARTLFIGDAFSDMIFATDGGYQKLLVLTGLVKEKELKGCDDVNILPKYYTNSMEEFHRLLENKLG